MVGQWIDAVSARQPEEIPKKHSTKYHEREDEQRCRVFSLRPTHRGNPGVGDGRELALKNLAVPPAAEFPRDSGGLRRTSEGFEDDLHELSSGCNGGGRGHTLALPRPFHSHWGMTHISN